MSIAGVKLKLPPLNLQGTKLIKQPGIAIWGFFHPVNSQMLSLLKNNITSSYMHSPPVVGCVSLAGGRAGLPEVYIERSGESVQPGCRVNSS